MVKILLKRKEEKTINLQGLVPLLPSSYLINCPKYFFYLLEERQIHDHQLARRERERKAEEELAEKRRREELRLQKEQREYKGFLEEKDMTSNQSMKGKTPQQYLDDFWG